MSKDNGNYNWNDNYNWYDQESGLAPITLMITIINLKLNLKCNYNCTCDLPQICTKLEIETY